MASEDVIKKFGNRVRVRVMGLLRKRNKVLLVNHDGLNKDNELWLPPGGGVEFGIGILESLKTEFLEETGLSVSIGHFLFANEFKSRSFHAVELFFECNHIDGDMRLGIDPEMGENQILQGIDYMNLEEIKSKGHMRYHEIFDSVNSIDELFAKQGFLNLCNYP